MEVPILDFSTKIVASKPADITLDFKKECAEIANSHSKTVKSEKFNFVKLSHNVSFSELVDKMHPISVEGLEHITGIFGRIEENDNEVSPIIQKSCTSDKKYEKTGKPNDGALVWAHIAFFLEGNTTPFNSSKLQKGGEQVLKLTDILPGILVAARYLHTGQCGQFLLPPHTMFGEQGSPPTIPKSATILLVLRCLRWIDADAPNRYGTLDDLSKNNFAIVQNILQNSNDAAGFYFMKKNYKTALSYYKKINDILNSLDTRPFCKKEVNSYKIKNFINMAICYNVLQNPSLALCHLDEAWALKGDNCNVKYLYTRGRSLMLLGRYEEALSFFLLVSKIDPNNTELGENYVKLDAIIKNQKAQEVSYLKNMFKAESKRNDAQNNASKSVNDLCEYLKTTSMASFPFPPYLLCSEEKEIETIAKSIDDVSIISQELRNENIQKYFVIKKNT